MRSANLLSRLEQLGPVSKAGNTFRAACPVCARGRGDSALSIRLEGERVLMHCHRCESSYLDILAALRIDARDLSPSSDWSPPARVEPTPDEAQRVKLERTWNTAYPLNGHDLASHYLEGRGLSLECYPFTLRCHPGLEYWDGGAVIGTFPVMLARVENRAGELMALHKTYLSPDGRGKAPVSPAKKLSRSVLEGGVMGAAVRLSVAGERLAVGEGIETSLAVKQVTGLPTWAAVSASGLERLEWPSSVKELLICADHDVNGRGLQAAHVLARRALEAGLTVRLAVPPLEGQDWLDSLLEGDVSGLLEAPTLTFAELAQVNRLSIPPAQSVRATVAPRHWKASFWNHARGLK